MKRWHEHGIPRSEVREWLAQVVGNGPEVITAMQARIKELEAEVERLKKRRK